MTKFRLPKVLTISVLSFCHLLIILDIFLYYYGTSQFMSLVFDSKHINVCSNSYIHQSSWWFWINKVHSRQQTSLVSIRCLTALAHMVRWWDEVAKGPEGHRKLQLKNVWEQTAPFMSMSLTWPISAFIDFLISHTSSMLQIKSNNTFLNIIQDHNDLCSLSLPQRTLGPLFCIHMPHTDQEGAERFRSSRHPLDVINLFLATTYFHTSVSSNVFGLM